jgi:adenylate kinase
VCDRCGSHDFVRRSDDNAETVKNRLMAYYRETAPLIGYYFAKGKLKTVDGMAPISEVSSQIQAILADYTAP